MVCNVDGCQAEIEQSKRVASVDGKYGGAVGRYAGVCKNGHLTIEDIVEGA